MPIASINITGKASLLVTSTSQSVLLPTAGTPTTVLLNNMGDYPIYVVLSTSSATVCTPTNGVPIQPRGTLALGVNAQTWLSAVGQGPLDIALGI